MRLTWASSGENYSNGNKAKIRSAIRQMEWMNLGTTRSAKSLPEIKKSIVDLDIHVSRIAISMALTPLKLYGIEASYENATALVFLIDDDLDLTLLAYKLKPKTQDS